MDESPQWAVAVVTAVVVAEITNDAIDICIKEQLIFGDQVVQCNVATSGTRSVCAKVTLRLRLYLRVTR